MGRMPKKNQSRPYDSEHGYQDRVLKPGERSYGKSRMDQLPGYHNYSAETRRWWDMWARSPQSRLFLETDWHTLVMLAPLVEQYFACPQVKLFHEITRAQKALGATLHARAVLRMEFDSDDPDEGDAEPDDAELDDELYELLNNG